MKKKEIVIRELLDIAVSEKPGITQLELSKKLNVSISTVNNAVKPLVQLGAVDAKRTGLAVIDLRKSLAYLASIRNLEKDIIYKTFAGNVADIEKSMPQNIIYTAFSGFKFIFGDVPADYSEVYVYSDEKTMPEIKKRFPLSKGPANLFVIKADEQLLRLSKNNAASLIQIYVDLWNMRQWYAKEFIAALEKKLKV